MSSTEGVCSRQVFRKKVPRIPCLSSMAAAWTCCASASSKVSDTTVVAQTQAPPTQTSTPGRASRVQVRPGAPGAPHAAPPLEPPGGCWPPSEPPGCWFPPEPSGCGWPRPHAATQQERTKARHILRMAPLPMTTGRTMATPLSFGQGTERFRDCRRSGEHRRSAPGGERLESLGPDVRRPTVDGGVDQPFDLERVLVEDRLDLRLVLDPQEQGAAFAWDERPGGDHLALGEQHAQVGAVTIQRLLHALERIAVPEHHEGVEGHGTPRQGAASRPNPTPGASGAKTGLRRRR